MTNIQSPTLKTMWTQLVSTSFGHFDIGPPHNSYAKKIEAAKFIVNCRSAVIAPPMSTSAPSLLDDASLHPSILTILDPGMDFNLTKTKPLEFHGSLKKVWVNQFVDVLPRKLTYVISPYLNQWLEDEINFLLKWSPFEMIDMRNHFPGSHTIHVWYIYLHEWLFLMVTYGIHVGKYTHGCYGDVY